MVNRSKVEQSSASGDKPASKSAAIDKSFTRTLRKSPSRGETVTKEAAPKSPSRNKSPGRKSPSRRSPIRKSPSRKSPTRKSPTRKSPSRKSPTKANSPKINRSSNRSRSNANLNKKLFTADTDSDEAEFDHVNVEKPKAAVRGRARKLDSDYSLPKDLQSTIDQEVTNFGVVLRSSSKSQANDIERIIHLKNDTAVKKLSEFSDEDEVPLKLKINSIREKSEGASDFNKEIEKNPKKDLNIGIANWLGALLSVLVLPCTFIAIYALCNESHIKFTQLPNLNKYKGLSAWFDSTIFLIYLGYVSLLAILSSLPIGGPKVSGLPNKQGKLTYVMNGLFIAVTTSIILITSEYFKISIISHILGKYFQLLVSATIAGILISIYLYIRSFYVLISALNPHALSKNKIYNFWIGREINPRIGKLDIKQCMVRVFIIAVLILNAIFVYKSIQFTSPVELQGYTLKGIKYNPTLLVIGGLQILYALDLLIFESSMVTTFDVQYEAVGYMTSVSLLAGSFITPLITKYVFDYNVRLPVWQLSAAVVLFFIGYILYRGSNNQKNAFRQNPYGPTVSHLESIPTSQGKKLLVSGYWGFVRHPNYLGDILMLLSFALFVWKSPAVIICILDIAFLIHRAHRDGKRCKERYGSAWNRYCQHVKYVLIPKIY